MITKARINLYMIFSIVKLEYKNYVWVIKNSTIAVIVFLILWIFTNGIWYWLAATKWGWITNFARGYLVFLWSPWSPEKLITIPLSFKIANNIRKKLRKRKLRRGESYEGYNKEWARKAIGYRP